MPSMYNVSSSRIESVGYEGGDLYVRFKRDFSLYVYYDVPKRIYQELRADSHPGKYLESHVIKAGYAYSKL